MIISPAADTILNLEQDIEEKKRQIAYQLWEDEGKPEGRSEEHWNQACLVLMTLDSPETSVTYQQQDIPVTDPIWLSRQTEDQSETLGSKMVRTRPVNKDFEGRVDEEVEILRKRVGNRSAA